MSPREVAATEGAARFCGKRMAADWRQTVADALEKGNHEHVLEIFDHLLFFVASLDMSNPEAH